MLPKGKSEKAKKAGFVGGANLRPFFYDMLRCRYHKRREPA